MSEKSDEEIIAASSLFHRPFDEAIIEVEHSLKECRLFLAFHRFSNLADAIEDFEERLAQAIIQRNKKPFQ